MTINKSSDKPNLKFSIQGRIDTEEDEQTGYNEGDQCR